MRIRIKGNFEILFREMLISLVIMEVSLEVFRNIENGFII